MNLRIELVCSFCEQKRPAIAGHLSRGWQRCICKLCLEEKSMVRNRRDVLADLAPGKKNPPR